MRIRIVDAFAARPFTGNPAGVLLLDDFPDDRQLQQVAAEVNLSETAFAHPLPAGGEADWALRWFTPVTEVDQCGHATLATAHVLHTTGIATGPVRFATRSGALTATPLPCGEGAGTASSAGRDTGVGTGTGTGTHEIALDFPTAPLTEVEVPEGMAEALGARPLAAYHTGPHIGDLLVLLADERTVRALAPDHPALVRHSARGVIATARADDPGAGSDQAGHDPARYDYVSRCFFPQVGIDEDPVTGSAHTALAPFWSPRLGRTSLTGLQASARTGLVRTELRGDRTVLTGRAFTVIEGELLVWPQGDDADDRDGGDDRDSGDPA